jgi:gamma-glutamyl hydrolase
MVRKTLAVVFLTFADASASTEPISGLRSRSNPPNHLDEIQKQNDWPIIGLFTQPSTSKRSECNGNCLYLAASYVKQIESAGARVVPINYYASPEQLEYLFQSLNGFLFVGGGSSFPQAAQYIFDRTIQANDEKDVMPLWGTCLGFEWLLIAAAQGDVDILDPPDGGQMDAYNISLPLEFTSLAKTSKLFSHASNEIFEILSQENVTMNNHHYGIFPEHFAATEALSSFYDILSLNKDRQGVEFVSTMEAKKYPIFGTQWHPEKNTFE